MKARVEMEYHSKLHKECEAARKNTDATYFSAMQVCVCEREWYVCVFSASARTLLTLVT